MKTPGPFITALTLPVSNHRQFLFFLLFALWQLCRRQCCPPLVRQLNRREDERMFGDTFGSVAVLEGTNAGIYTDTSEQRLGTGHNSLKSANQLQARIKWKGIFFGNGLHANTGKTVYTYCSL